MFFVLCYVFPTPHDVKATFILFMYNNERVYGYIHSLEHEQPISDPSTATPAVQKAGS